MLEHAHKKNHLKIKYNQIDFNFELDPYLTNPKSHTKFHQATSSGSLDLWEGGGDGQTKKERKTQRKTQTKKCCDPSIYVYTFAKASTYFNLPTPSCFYIVVPRCWDLGMINIDSVIPKLMFDYQSSAIR